MTSPENADSFKDIIAPNYSSHDALLLCEVSLRLISPSKNIECDHLINIIH